MDKKALILTIAKDIFLAKTGAASLKEAVKVVEEAFDSIKG